MKSKEGESERKFEGKRESNMTREMMTIVINYKRARGVRQMIGEEIEMREKFSPRL